MICLKNRNSLSFLLVETSENIFYSLIHKCSSFQRLCNIMVFVLRFTKLLPYRKEIAISDIDEAEKYFIKILQRIRFADLLLCLKKGKIIPSNFRNLSPFLDKNEIIRVGGRISNAEIGYNHRHPYLLPKNEHFVKILIDNYHRKNFHTGSHLLHSLIRTKYWIISARTMIRSES